MLMIRLQRAGKKNKPEYRVILAEKAAAVNKKFIEILGNYNPHSKTLLVRNQERLNYWLEQRVAMSPTVHNLFVSQNIITEKKTKSFSIPKKPVEAVAETPAPAPAADAAPAETAEAPTPEAEAPVETPAEVASEVSAETQS